MSKKEERKKKVKRLKKFFAVKPTSTADNPKEDKKESKDLDIGLPVSNMDMAKLKEDAEKLDPPQSDEESDTATA